MVIKIKGLCELLKYIAYWSDQGPMLTKQQSR